MKIILTTLNSKFTHTSLSLRLIGNWLRERGISAQWLEYTINTPIYQIIGDLFREKPDVLIFSVYIWNGNETRRIARELKKLLPNCKIVFGGPEVSFDSKQEMENCPFVDGIISGEGEAAVEQLLCKWAEDFDCENLHEVQGLTWKKAGTLFENSPPRPIEMDQLAFPYPDLEQLNHRILYYESSRGCPYNCSYCLSSATKGVRFKSDTAFQSDMMRFIGAKVMQVKFIDRTFNADPTRALRLWKWLSEHDNGITNFHFEITAELLRDEDLQFLSLLRPGLFQFEIGIQTTMKEASEAVNRRLAFDKLKGPVTTLLKAGNLHIHLDLIAGLPYEGYNRFLQSFDDVYALEPQVLQLGFLKLIKGSAIRVQAKEHGYVYEDYQPYEVLQTKYIGFNELLMLKDIEICLECLHNSKRFKRSLGLILKKYERSSIFYETFAKWLRDRGELNESIKAEKWYEYLWHFAKEQLGIELKLTLLLDFMSSLGKTPPEWLIETFGIEVKERVFELAKTNLLSGLIPQLEIISPKERVKRIRFAGIDKEMTNLLINNLSETVILSDDSGVDTGIILVDINSKHPVSEQYPIYIFV